MAKKKMEIPVDYRMCRMRGRHSYPADPIAPPGIGTRKKDLGGVRVYWQCDLCGTILEQIWSYLGQILATNYIHPEDYAMKKDEIPEKTQQRLFFLEEYGYDIPTPKRTAARRAVAAHDRSRATTTKPRRLRAVS